MRLLIEGMLALELAEEERSVVLSVRRRFGDCILLCCVGEVINLCWKCCNFELL